MKGAKIMQKLVAGKKLLLEHDPPNLTFLDDFQSVGGKLWPASDLMVNYFIKHSTVLNKNVLELGSGCGYVGIACGALGAKSVTLTDRTLTQRNLMYDAEGMLIEDNLPPNRLLLDICERNIERNREATKDSMMYVKELQWGEDCKQHVTQLLSDKNTPNFDVIVGSDVTYHPHLSDSLFWTVSKLLKHMKSQATGVNTIIGTTVHKFIAAHQCRLGTTTTSAIATASQFGLQCKVLSEGKGNHSNNIAVDDSVAKKDSEDFILWEFTLS